MAAETWTGEWWKHGGGGNAWHGFTYDAELDQLYIGTGNGSPWNRKIRSPGGGDNLFLSSIVALDPDTGDYLWHYQTTPGESWDYNSNMDIVLADLEIDGKVVKALMHAPKNGFFYVIDRSNGQLISAEPFAETTWATHVDLQTGRPVEVTGARYEEGPAIISPSPWGAHSWHAMSYNPGTGLAYLPTMNLTTVYTDEKVDVENWEPAAFVKGHQGVDVIELKVVEGKPPGSLQAIDPVTGKPAWEIPLSGIWNAGTMTTAGNLLFQGRADGEFVAYDARNGDKLWTFEAGLGISAPPITYAVDGRQYVAVLVGFGGGAAGIASQVEISHGWAYGQQTRRLVVFSLQGAADMPAQPTPQPAQPLAVPEFEVDEDLARAGAQVYGFCSYCHGNDAVSGGMAPDLRASPVVASFDSLVDIVRDGARKDRGMPQFPDFGDDHILAVQHYIRMRAERALEE
jgi:quinohemoprotein ethanol dehydrogenase